ncbi:hypothetical protein ACHAXA_010350 [Cyclostephanos tholiformis]|uniref:Uncharacterized protein n=1 Tax=Cyclostephanos tholiformis TaxID=382380 RepID=A0ABD3RV14_9STRA
MGMRIPRIDLHFDPITILKIRKSWHDVIPGAILRVGADFVSHRRLGGWGGAWRLRGCVEDRLIGGRLTIRESHGRRRRVGGEDEEDENDDVDDDANDRAVLVEYSKSWLFSGAGSTGTRFNLCATYDLTSRKGSARFGFRAESNVDAAAGSYHLMPGGRRGFSIVPIIPLDRNGRLLLEAKTNVDLPEPEFVIGTNFNTDVDNDQTLEMGIGGDVQVEFEEVNLIFFL